MIKLKKKELFQGVGERLLYTSDENIDPIAIIEAMENSDFGIKEVCLSEDADVGLKYFQGNYSAEKAKELYPKVKNDVESIYIRMKYGCSIYINGTSMIISYPSNISFDISKYINLS